MPDALETHQQQVMAGHADEEGSVNVKPYAWQGPASRLVSLCALLVIGWGVAVAQDPQPSAPAIPELARLEELFAKEESEKVDLIHGAELQKVNKAYRSALEACLKRFAGAGQLDEAVAVKEELKRFSDAETIPDTDEPRTNPEVARLRKAWRMDISRLQKQRSLGMKPIIEAHLRRLRQLELDFTRALKLDEAKAVKARRESFANNAAVSGMALSPPPVAAENLAGSRPAQKMDLYASGNNGCIIRINGNELVTAKRDKASKVSAGLQEGDVIAVRLSDRFDINSFWMSCLSDTGQFLFETSERWRSYIPADTEKWWIIKDAKKQKPAQFASDKREYVGLVKKSAATTPHYNHAQPICSVLSDGTRIAYVYYVVTKNDLLPKK